MTATRHNAGFTLIELLVVISIITFLSSIVLSAVQAAKIKARDTRRLRDLKELQTAINLYFNATGSYPPTEISGYIVSTDPLWNSAGGKLHDALVPTYISTMPKDPVNDGTYNYSYAAPPPTVGLYLRCPGGSTSGNQYVLQFRTEQASAFGSSIDLSNNSSRYCLYTQ